MDRLRVGIGTEGGSPRVCSVIMPQPKGQLLPWHERF